MLFFILDSILHLPISLVRLHGRTREEASRARTRVRARARSPDSLIRGTHPAPPSGFKASAIAAPSENQTLPRAHGTLTATCMPSSCFCLISSGAAAGALLVHAAQPACRCLPCPALYMISCWAGILGRLRVTIRPQHDGPQGCSWFFESPFELKPPSCPAVRR